MCICFFPFTKACSGDFQWSHNAVFFLFAYFCILFYSPRWDIHSSSLLLRWLCVHLVVVTYVPSSTNSFVVGPLQSSHILFLKGFRNMVRYNVLLYLAICVCTFLYIHAKISQSMCMCKYLKLKRICTHTHTHTQVHCEYHISHLSPSI